MTDKQIIIDCVNVSEWTDGEVYYKLEHYSPKATKQIAFDLYKQLKRKEQECEELKQKLHQCWTIENSFVEQLDRLKRKEQECEGLKETLKTKAKGWANVNDKILEEVKQIRVENEKLKTALKFRDSSIDAKNKEILKKCKNNRELIDKNWKLIKTLTEIKEIAEENDELLQGYHKEWANNKLILQKISEVENETIK